MSDKFAKKDCPECQKRYTSSTCWKKIPKPDEMCVECWSIELVGRMPLQDGVQIIGGYRDGQLV